MAQTKKRRNRKHRGTQAGTIETRGRTGRGSAAAARSGGVAKTAKERRQERMNRPPTWRSSFNRAAIAAAIFGLVVVLGFGQTVAQGVPLAALMLLVYVPMTYYLDTFLYRRAQRRVAADRSGKPKRPK